ncbi:fibrinogen-like YCDxxxxGGGW domain-containing protein [Tamaricihabitans halophyticus]|nr:fibrinogen-like YCDxxxxGGGW domain-containing protein [Tamaricihabitans halophyticus]
MAVKRGGVFGAVGLLAASLIVLGTGTAQAQQAKPTGRSAADAAASCWEAKQNDSRAQDGVYWLQTPELIAPEQFYCDMTTDGGGWVLIGRGRENWRPEYRGQGSPAEVRNNVTGQAAFNPRKLDGDIVDGLLNGGRVDELGDGIRLRRATNTSGTRWQEARFNFADQDRWTWSFEAGHIVGSYRFDGTSGSGGYTNNFGRDSSLRRVDTRERQDQGWTRGWAFGSLTSGSSSASSYLWSRTSGRGYARPFTQVFLRPKLTQADMSYSPIADGGTAKRELSPLLQSGAEPQSWGVTGRADGNNGELNTESQAFTQVGETVYVGGNFRYVQNGADGQRVDQSYLAGFNVRTGEWVSSFRPKFNAQVKDLATLPDGRLVVAGEFTEVNGEEQVGLVSLDPSTGQTDPSWNVEVQDNTATGVVKVRALDVQDNWLYLGGTFTHLKGGNQSQPAYARNSGRVSITNGNADHGWNPEFNGTVFDIDASADGSRFYAVGHLTTSRGVSSDKVAVVSTEPGAALVPGLQKPKFSSSTNYQQAIVEVGDRVFVGGSQHSLFSYNRSDFAIKSGSITTAGGDFQSAEAYDGTVYGTCHCEHWNYSESYTWPNVGQNWTQGDKISFIGAYDAATGEYQPEFNPWLNASLSQGPWGSFQDSTGKVWFSGDLTRGRMNNGGWTWLGGFVRFAPRDTTAPSTPANLRSGPGAAGKVRLSWSGSTDDRQVAGYEILLQDRVIGRTTGQTSYEVDTPTSTARYFVRAVDREGNRSASTSVHAVQPAAAVAKRTEQPEPSESAPSESPAEPTPTSESAPPPSTSARPVEPSSSTSPPSQRVGP